MNWELAMSVRPPDVRPTRPSKIISGGQTGADQGGLIGALRAGIATGGMAPKGYRTEDGSNFVLRDVFNLEEHDSPQYPPRTAENVINSDATVIVGNTSSAGSLLTIKLCDQHRKPRILNPTPAMLREFVEQHRVTILNIAGNRESKQPGICERTATLITDAFGS